MRPLLSGALVALALSSFVPLASAGPSCVVPSQAAAEPVLDDVYYVRLYDGATATHVQVWREANDVPGLQTINWRCAAGDFWPADALLLSIPLSVGGAIPL